MINQHEGMSITEARKRLTQLPEELEHLGWAVPLTLHGTPVMAELKLAIEQLERGESRPWEDVKAELDRQ